MTAALPTAGLDLCLTLAALPAASHPEDTALPQAALAVTSAQLSGAPESAALALAESEGRRPSAAVGYACGRLLASDPTRESLAAVLTRLGWPLPAPAPDANYASTPADISAAATACVWGLLDVAGFDDSGSSRPRAHVVFLDTICDAVLAALAPSAPVGGACATLAAR